jgi:hypothetical protein
MAYEISKHFLTSPNEHTEDIGSTQIPFVSVFVFKCLKSLKLFEIEVTKDFTIQ